MKTVQLPASSFGLKSMHALNYSRNARAPKADITNAPFLFGDVFGDVEEGDADDEDGDPNLYGDVNLYGDINDATLALFKTISGDPRINQNTKKKLMLAGLLTAGGAATVAGGIKIKKMLEARRRQKTHSQGLIKRFSKKQTLFNQKVVQSNPGTINKKSFKPFFELMGAKLNSAQIEPLSAFPADTLKVILDRQNIDTPFLQETALGVFAAGVWTVTATGAATNRFYYPLIVQLGINQLNAAPGTVFTITGTLPLINGGTLTIATPFIFTIEKQFDVRFLLHPWQLVANKPLPVLGQYSNANPIVLTVNGLPAASAVSLVVPGSLHPWVASMRNALV
jgi:hypothetical protein